MTSTVKFADAMDADTMDFSALFDASPHSVLVTVPALAGRDQKIVYVNSAFERMSGWRRADITGLTPAVLQGPDTDRSIFADLRDKLARGESWSGETLNYRRDATPFWLSWSISPVRDGDGTIAAFLAIQQDVTARRRTEDALMASEQRYRAIFEHSFQLMSVLDLDGTVREVNDTALKFANVKPSQVVGRPFWDTHWWQACAESREQLRRAIKTAATGINVAFRARCLGVDGRVHDIDFSVKPVCDDTGRTIMLVPEGRDVTPLLEQKRQLRRETLRLRNAQRIGRMGGWDFDLATGVFHSRPETLELLGIPEGQATMTRADVEAIIHPDDLPRQRAALDHACETGARYDVKFRIAMPNGEYVVNVVGEPVRDEAGRLTGLVGIVQDITERDRVEQELIAARQAAEAASEAKSRFLATISHELRTPLNAINGFSEMMLQEALGPLGQPAYRGYCQHILDSGLHLLDMINRILGATRLELGCDQPELEAVKTRPLLQSVASQMHPIAAARSVTVDCRIPDDVVLKADPRLLRQVLFNLIGNAVKFAPERSVVDVTGTATPDGGYQFVVSDSGPGISDDFRDRALLPFQQGDDSLARRHEGLGLGLYIVDRIVAAHGGRLTLDTSPTSGARVIARFPAASILDA